MITKNNSLLILLMVSVIATFSCKEDDTVKKNLNNITGTWVLDKLANTNCSNTDDNGLTNVPCNSTECTKYIFNEADSTGVREYILQTVVEGLTFNDVGTYSLSESNISLCQEVEDEMTCVTYNLEVGSTNMTLYVNESGCKKEQLFVKEQEI